MIQKSCCHLGWKNCNSSKNLDPAFCHIPFEVQKWHTTFPTIFGNTKSNHNNSVSNYLLLPTTYHTIMHLLLTGLLKRFCFKQILQTADNSVSSFLAFTTAVNTWALTSGTASLLHMSFSLSSNKARYFVVTKEDVLVALIKPSVFPKSEEVFFYC